MVAMSDEKKLSIAMKRGLGMIGFEPSLVVLDYMRENSNMQNRMMDLIMGFLSTWAAHYEAGTTREGEIMHRLGETSATMLASLTAVSGGRHCAGRTTPTP